jgi:hypothetical protein
VEKPWRLLRPNQKGNTVGKTATEGIGRNTDNRNDVKKKNFLESRRRLWLKPYHPKKMTNQGIQKPEKTDVVVAVEIVGAEVRVRKLQIHLYRE